MAKKAKKSVAKGKGKRKSVGTSKVLLTVGILLFLLFASFALLMPNKVQRFYTRILRHLNSNPQSTYVLLPEQEVIGIDVSSYQKGIDWDKLEFHYDNKKKLTKDTEANKRPVDFIIAKATEGVTIQDKQYAVNKAGAKEKKIPFGAYHYFSVTSDANQQANNFIRTAKLQAGDIVPILDVEYQGKLTTKELRTRVLTWLKTVEKKYGRKPIIYTYANFYEDVFMTKEFSDYHFWLAHYKVSKPQNECSFWQFTEDGVVCGIDGYVDIDVFFGKKTELTKYKL